MESRGERGKTRRKGGREVRGENKNVIQGDRGERRGK